MHAKLICGRGEGWEVWSWIDFDVSMRGGRLDLVMV